MSENQSQTGLVINDDDRVDDSLGETNTIEQRVEKLEDIAKQQTAFFVDSAKSSDSLANLAGHVALLAKAFCVMERRYGVSPDNSMGEYLFKKMEPTIPKEMRTAAEEHGFVFDGGEMSITPTHSAKRRADTLQQSTSAKASKMAPFKAKEFELDGVLYTSKEQPFIKNDGNVCLAYINGQPGHMLHVLSDDDTVKFNQTFIDQVQKVAMKGAPYKLNHQQHINRLSLFVQHLIKTFIGSKTKLPLVVCASIDPDAPQDTVRSFLAGQGQLLSYMLKVASKTTNLIALEKPEIVQVMQTVCVQLKVFSDWAKGTGRLEIQQIEEGASAASATTEDDDLNFFEEN